MPNTYRLIFAAAMAAIAAPSAGQVPVADLAKPPPGADGMPATLVVRGITPEGDAAESFRIDGGSASWRSPIDAGGAPYAAPAFYVAQGGPVDTNAWLLERVLASPGHTLALLPGGQAHAAKLTSLEVGAGASRQTVTLWSLTGLNNSPVPIWADADGKFFGMTVGIAWLPAAYAGELDRLDKAQAAAVAALAPGLVRALVTIPRGPVAFRDVRSFDADKLRFLAGQTVVVGHGRIAAVGPAGTVEIPAGARIIEGRGKTLIPGLWDCHLHVGDDYTGPQELSLGVTSVRDPGNDDLLTIDRRTRAAAGRLLFPHVYPSSLIDGRGPYTAQVANVATSQTEAIAFVDRAKANRFTGVKFYGTFNPAWLPATIAEAHKLGLHVHGHIPAGIRPMEAIADGYDEITHINWIIMQAMPDSVIQVSNGVMRFEGPGRYAKDVDLDGSAMTAIVATMAKKHIYSDPTMVAFESLYVPENGDLSPSYAPFAGTMPPVAERSFRSGGFAVPKDLTRADYRASWAKMVALLKRMHETGVPIVPARLVGRDKHTGSIKVGKDADLALIDGDPSLRLGDLRQTRLVMLDGKLLDADALRTAAGFFGRPK